MDTHDFHKDFVDAINNRIYNYVNEVHLALKKQYELFVLINKYKDYYESHDINISNIYNEDNTKKITFTKKQIDSIDRLKSSYILSYNYITCEKLKHLYNQINILNTIKNIPYFLYNILLDYFNTEISNFILKGNKYSFGNNLGSIYIKLIPRIYTKRTMAINWGETTKLKKRLIEANIPIYSDANPNGKKYFVYMDDDDYCMLYWRKKQSTIVNKQYYSLKAQANKNVMFSELEDKTIDGILNNKQLALFDKMIFLLKSNPQVKELYKR